MRSTPAISRGTVYVGSFDGNLYALGLLTGELVWRYETEGHTLVSADWGFDRRSIQSSPAVDDSLVYFGARDGFEYAVNATTGELVWRLDHESSWGNTSAAVADGIVYSGSSSSAFVHAVRGATGEELWRVSASSGVFSSPSVAGNTTYVGNNGGTLFAIDRNSGDVRWRFRAGGGIFSSPVITSGKVLFGSDDGRLYALSLTDGAAMKRTVFWDEALAEQSLFSRHEDVRDYFSRAGYEIVDAAALHDLFEDQVAGEGQSVVVFAMDAIPSGVAPEAADTVLFRRYLEDGGKVVWLGRPPMWIVRDATGSITGVDVERPEALLGVEHAFDGDEYGIRATAAGTEWGVPRWWIGPGGIDASAVSTALGLDANGRASAWVKSYGGSTGTGFVYLGGRLARENLDVVRAVAEHGVFRFVKNR